jgi:hypothetical protein
VKQAEGHELIVPEPELARSWSRDQSRSRKPSSDAYGTVSGTHTVKRAAAPQLAPTSMSRDQIASVVTTLSDALIVLGDADPADKAQIYVGLGLRLTYQPGEQLVRTEVQISPAQHWQFESVRGGT